MKKIYYLSTCNTCKRILSELDVSSGFKFQDIKVNPLSKEDLEHLKSLAGSYQALFNKRAKLYKERDLKNRILSEEDYKNFLLEHYTFLKRPVIVNGQEVYIGNSKKTVEAAKAAMHE